MDSANPDDVLKMITDDFFMSVQFSTGGGTSAEFVGDRAGLVRYLEQRERERSGARRRRRAAAWATPSWRSARTTRDGEFEATFNASAQLVDGRIRRLLICRTPELAFD